MTKFFDPDSGHDGRLYAPATQRNREVIADALGDLLAPSGVLLELASGTGEHATHIAPKLEGWRWIASDLEAHHQRSIDAWNAHLNAGLDPAIHLDVTHQNWPLDHAVDVVFAANLVHIAPADVSQAVMRGADAVLRPGGILLLYGPFMINGAHTSVSNAVFDAKLKANNPAWGIRDHGWLTDLAAAHGLITDIQRPMPANNFIMGFVKPA